MKCPKKVSAIIIMLITLSLLTQPVAVFGNNIEWGVKEGDTITWTVVIAPNTTFWWWDPVTGLVKVEVNEGDIMEYNITKIDDDTLYGDFKIGNLTVANVTTDTIGMNLVFGLWPFITGPVVKPDWQNITSKAEDCNVKTIEESNFEWYLGLPRHVIIFANETDSGAFRLVYEKSTGVMLYGYGRFGKYELGVEIKSTTVSLGVSEILYIIVGVPIIVIIAIVIVSIFIKKKE